MIENPPSATVVDPLLLPTHNHTSEGNENGPTISFRGLTDEAYYLWPSDRRHYTNYSG